MDVYWLEQSGPDVPDGNGWLSSQEALHLATLRFPKRRADWRLGRWTAKCALAACVRDTRPLADIQIQAAASGAPEVLGANPPAISISHRNGVACCAIALGAAALGCDLELIEPRSREFVATYFTPEEETLIEQTSAAARPALLAVLWSAKESALKALGVGLRLDTRSVAVRNLTFELDPPQLWQPLQVCYEGREFNGWWRSDGTLVRTLVAAPQPDAPRLLTAGFSK
jgi:4'-phosphopantetheinyl transferase